MLKFLPSSKLKNEFQINNMKTYFLIWALLATGLWSVPVFSQTANKPDSLGLPGDNLDLYAVLDLFQKSKTIEDFEKSLNLEKTGINNLDLNLDQKVDFIKVVTKKDGDDFTFILQVAVTEKETQDVAVILVSKDKDKKVAMQIVGDVTLYGKNYVVEPKAAAPAATANPGYTGTDPLKAPAPVNTTTVVVEQSPIVVYVYSPAYVPYVPPYHYGYYPPYFVPVAVITRSIYRANHYNNYYHHGGYGHTTVVVNNNTYNNYNNTRNTSNTVNRNNASGNYNGNRPANTSGNTGNRTANTGGTKASTQPAGGANKASTQPSAGNNKASTQPSAGNNKASTQPSAGGNKASTQPSSRSSASPSAQPSSSKSSASPSSRQSPSSTGGSKGGSSRGGGGGRGGRR